MKAEKDIAMEERDEIIEEAQLPRDAGNWAKSVDTLSVGELPETAINRNVEGRRVMSPTQGFGKMWQKTYRIPLAGAAPAPSELIAEWKQNFPSFWPARNFFYSPLTGIAPGDVAVLNLAMPGGLKMSTGVMVMYADDESFTLMTPQGHMFAGWITFSSYVADDATVAQVQVLLRANDPIFELGMIFGGHRKEDRFWEHTLTAVAQHFGATGEVSLDMVCVDKRRQWRYAKNVWHNSAIRSGFYATAAPFRWMAKPFRRKREDKTPN